jgi:hypothetical protein
MFQSPIRALTFVVVTAGVTAISAAAQAAEIPRAQAVVPEGMAALSDTLTGSYFVAAPLKRQYDDLLGRLDALKRDIDRGRIAGPAALKQVDDLREKLQELRAKVDKAKVLIPIVQAHSQVQTTSFDIGPDRLVVVTADQVRIVGSDGDKIRCTLEKVFLGGDAKEAEAELAAIKVVYSGGIQPDIVGKTAAEQEGDEVKFLRSPEGLKLGPVALINRKSLVDSIRANWDRYRDFQGKAVDSVRVEGLTWQDGNKQMTLKLSAKEGSCSERSVWRRHAKLTIQVPKCQRLAVRGALAGLEVENVQGSLLVVSDDNHNRDYEAQFRVRGVDGDVTVLDFPLNSVENVTGNVNIHSLRDFANSGTSHTGDGQRMLYWNRPLPCVVKNIGGDFYSQFSRAELQVEDVRGRMAVANESGDTHLVVGRPLGSAAHRLDTVSGTIDVSFRAGALGRLPVIAAMNHGTLRTNASQSEFPTFMIGGSGGSSRDWHGVHRVQGNDKEDRGLDTLRLVESLKPQNDSPGLVIRALAGTIVVTVAEK